MSRVGRRILEIPNEVSLTLSDNNLKVSGPLGELEASFSPLITIKIDNNKLTTHRKNEEKATKQLHGTSNSLISSMLKGVVTYFEKTLIIQGVGYKAQLLDENTIELLTGYSHPVLLKIPQSLKVELIKPTEIRVKGINKQEVGAFSAKIRAVRKPNPYSGKGISYQNEKIRRKEGKKTSK